MAHRVRASRAAASLNRTLKLTGVMASLTATLLLGACAETADLLPKANASLAQNSDDGSADKPEVPQNELQKATTYWGQEYAKRTSELKPALNYARNLKALGEKNKALAVLQQAASLHDSDPELAGEYGRLALELDQVNVAGRMLQIADDPSKPDWKVINARGTVLAKQGQYKDAIPYYERALTLAQNQPSVLNNLAMAYAMSGDAKKAEDLLRQASAGSTGENASKVKQNLALVLGLEGRYDEAKAVTAGTSSAAAVAENVDMVRRIVKLEPKVAPAAVAAAPDFKTKVTRAIATAETTPVTDPGDAFVPPANTAAAPVFKAAVADAPAAAATVWQATASAAPSTPTSGLKGSAP
jgi:Flp pilus assembly protein TadD